MSIAASHSGELHPVCSQAGGRLAAFPAGEVGRAERAEGKIKETGTPLARFQGKPLSAHCFGAPRAAPSISASRAATSRKALALLGFDRHHSRESAVFRAFRLEALV